MKKTLILFCALIIILTGLYPPVVKAQDISDTIKGLNKTANQVAPFKSQTGSNYNNFIQTKTGEIVGIVLSFVGVLFLILIIYAGISWMTAMGNQEKVTKARNLMINAIIGIIIIFAAYAITSFIGNQIVK